MLLALLHLNIAQGFHCWAGLGLSGHLNVHTAQLSLGAFGCFSHMSPFSSPRSQLMFHLLQGDAQNASVVMSPGFIPRPLLT